MAQKAGHSCISTSAFIYSLLHVIHAFLSVRDVFSLGHISAVVLSLLSAASAWLQEMKSWFDAAADGPGWPESKLVPGACRVAKFNGVHTLILHIPENFGADHTRITFIGIKGDFSEVGLRPALFVAPIHDLRHFLNHNLPCLSLACSNPGSKACSSAEL